VEIKEQDTLQLWPGGKTVKYKVDALAVWIAEGEGWRLALPKEVKEIDREKRARLYQERDVLGCDTGLVGDLQAASTGARVVEAFGVDEVRNWYQAAPETVEECWERLRELGERIPDAPKVICETCGGDGDHTYEDDEGEEASTTCEDCGGDGEVQDPDAEEDTGYLRRLQAACNDAAEVREVFEWWRVSAWLGDELDSIGEVMLINQYGSWWGRTCTGQALIMDGVLQQVAGRHV
jgi:hypothetical protein